MIRKSTFLSAIIIATSLFSLNAHAVVDDIPIKVKWGYKGNIGPTRWGQLDPDFILCSKGKFQSPINIPSKVPNNSYSLNINYQPAPFVIVEDGITDITIGEKQILTNTGHSIQLNFPINHSKESIMFEGEDYRLIQFHFHSPSETTVHDQSYPLEIHFVHQGKNGKAAVIAVFVKTGNENPVLQKIINHLPMDKGKEHTIENEQINPHDLIPNNLDFYYFEGSLTTPPCTEGVKWIVMSEALNASSAQVAQIRKAINGVNARPTQPLYDREIFYSKTN